MSYRDYFCIFELLLFTVVSVLLLLKYFCVEPFYSWMTPKTESGVVKFMFVMWYYALSILAVVIEVGAGGFITTDGMTTYEFVTMFQVFPLIGLFLFYVYVLLKNVLMFLVNTHERILKKRMGDQHEHN